MPYRYTYGPGDTIGKPNSQDIQARFPDLAPNGIIGAEFYDEPPPAYVSVYAALAALVAPLGVTMTDGEMQDFLKGNAGLSFLDKVHEADSSIDTLPKLMASLSGAPGADAYQVWRDAGNTGSRTDFLAAMKGAPGSPGAPGNPGSAGADAYAVWVAAGNTGSRSDFIAAMKGAPGNPGATGLSAFQVAAANGFTGTASAFVDSLKGGKGDTGSDAYAVAVAAGFTGDRAAWLASLKGAKGDIGPGLAASGTATVPSGLLVNVPTNVDVPLDRVMPSTDYLVIAQARTAAGIGVVSAEAVALTTTKARATIRNITLANLGSPVTITVFAFARVTGGTV